MRFHADNNAALRTWRVDLEHQFIAWFIARLIAWFIDQFVAQFVAQFIARFVARFVAQFVAWFIAQFVARFDFTVLFHKLASYMHASPAQLCYRVLGRQGKQCAGIQVTSYSTTRMWVTKRWLLHSHSYSSRIRGWVFPYIKSKIE